MRRSTIPAPAPVTVFRPTTNGSLEIAEVIEHPVSKPMQNDFEPDVVTHRFRLIAVQETGEHMFAGYATTRGQALDRKYEWLNSHPEHSDVLIENL